MQKLFHISPAVANHLESVAKENGSSQSRIVESAIVLYLSMYSGLTAFKKQSEQLPGQMSLFDKIGKESKAKG